MWFEFQFVIHIPSNINPNMGQTIEMNYWSLPKAWNEMVQSASSTNHLTITRLEIYISLNTYINMETNGNGHDIKFCKWQTKYAQNSLSCLKLTSEEINL